jgi:hypothetical protein
MACTRFDGLMEHFFLKKMGVRPAARLGPKLITESALPMSTSAHASGFPSPLNATPLLSPRRKWDLPPKTPTPRHTRAATSDLCLRSSPKHDTLASALQEHLEIAAVPQWVQVACTPPDTPQKSSIWARAGSLESSSQPPSAPASPTAQYSLQQPLLISGPSSSPTNASKPRSFLEPRRVDDDDIFAAMNATHSSSPLRTVSRLSPPRADTHGDLSDFSPNQAVHTFSPSSSFVDNMIDITPRRGGRAPPLRLSAARIVTTPNPRNFRRDANWPGNPTASPSIRGAI